MDKDIEHIVNVCQTVGLYEGSMHYIHTSATKEVKRSWLARILWPGRGATKMINSGLWRVQRYEDAVILPYDDTLADFQDLQFAAIYFHSLENEERKHKKEIKDGQTEGQQE